MSAIFRSILTTSITDSTAGGRSTMKNVLGTTVLVAGTKTITYAPVTANTLIQPTIQALGTVTAPKALAISRSVGVSFTITSSDNTDTSVIGYEIIEP